MLFSWFYKSSLVCSLVCVAVKTINRFRVELQHCNTLSEFKSEQMSVVTESWVGLRCLNIREQIALQILKKRASLKHKRFQCFLAHQEIVINILINDTLITRKSTKTHLSCYTTPPLLLKKRSAIWLCNTVAKEDIERQKKINILGCASKHRICY